MASSLCPVCMIAKMTDAAKKKEATMALDMSKGRDEEG